jgi:hypothetical protein
MKYKESFIKVQDLILDKSNPRFAELYTGQHNEDSLIKYLLLNEAAIDVAKGIVREGGFYADRPLWVIEQNGKYLVKDGNRRCAAVKALRAPGKYGMDFPLMNILKLPVLIYNLEEDVDERIFQEHANSLFRSWERIAKALEVYRLFTNGNSINSMRDLDSSPGQLVKLASFYFEAVKIGGDDLRDLLSRREGKTGGRTIIFERLFAPKISVMCGYTFKNSPYFELQILDQAKFNSYIDSMVKLLKDDVNYDIKTETVDNDKEKFLGQLKSYGFDVKKSGSTSGNTSQGTTTSNNSALSGTSGNVADSSLSGGSVDSVGNNSHSTVDNRGSNKKKPTPKRKGLEAGITKRIKECYSLKPDTFPNAKFAMARVTFECILKYIVDKTYYSKRSTMSKSNYFHKAYKKPDGTPLPSTNFDILKSKFTEIILDKGKRRAFEQFDLEGPHQVIHNYDYLGIPTDADTYTLNLIPLIDFMLQSEVDLLNSLDLTRL